MFSSFGTPVCMRDLEHRNDIVIIVNDFYERARTDDVIGPVFNEHIADDQWDHHLERMYDFWNTALFGTSDYLGNPLGVHLGLGLKDRHFDRWQDLMAQSIRGSFEGQVTEEALHKVKTLAIIFQSKIAHSEPGKH